jgi:hypothetical protein
LAGADRVKDKDAIIKAFNEVVNLSPAELKAWLARDESKQVGTTRPGETETVGRQMGKAILKIKAKKADALTAADFASMRKVIGFVRRHRAGRPRGDVSATRWRYALLNWGHDPLLDEYER